MKTILAIILLFFIFNLASQAQGKYSLESLGNLSQEELNIYLDEALKLRKNGKIVTIVGGVALATAVVWGITDPLDHELGTVLEAGIVGILGLGTMAVGIPMIISGKNRVERINTIENTAYNSISIDLKPCINYNFITQNYQPGATLRISFYGKTNDN
jgi:hypothetical protein